MLVLDVAHDYFYVCCPFSFLGVLGAGELFVVVFIYLVLMRVFMCLVFVFWLPILIFLALCWPFCGFQDELS